MNTYLVKGSNTNNCVLTGSLRITGLLIHKVFICECIDIHCTKGNFIYKTFYCGGSSNFVLLKKNYVSLLKALNG